jgi:translation elongation factor EF-Tu-like GTPase
LARYDGERRREHILLGRRDSGIVVFEQVDLVDDAELLDLSTGNP